jgi:pimeloyl-ACP methyl ester carboxylesterase
VGPRGRLPKVEERATKEATLVLVGADDVVTPPAVAREMRARIPGACLEIIPGAGHLAPVEEPAVEEPEATSAALVRFLERLPA